MENLIIITDELNYNKIQNELIGLYDAWRNLIKEYEKIDFV